MLRISLFQSLRARAGELDLPPPPRHETAQLWIYLLLHREVELRRDRVAFELWPDVPEATAKARLRRNLHRLRTTLPRSSDDQAWIVSTSHMLRWNPAVECWIDIDAFESLCRRVQALDPRDDASAVRACLEQAVALYVGDLLVGFDDAWLDAHRQRLRASFVRALNDLGAAQTLLGDLDAARATSEALLACDPLHEVATARLMRLLWAREERGAAVAVYEQFRDGLAQAHGLAPLPTTTALDAAIRGGEPAEVAWEAAGERGGVSEPGLTSRRVDAGPAGGTSGVPEPLSRLIGRQPEIETITRLVHDHRLLTLVGPGGVGKTRLAAAAAHKLAGHFADGLRWVELAPISDPDLVVQAVAAACGVQPERDRPLIRTLSTVLADKQLVLIIDNCEHVLDAAARLSAALLAAAPALGILATSRERLGLDGEIAWSVPPLSLPALEPAISQEALLAAESVQLFVDRVHARWSQYSLNRERLRAIAEICAQVEGIPLAIELAAARIGVLPLEDIAARLSDGLQLLRVHHRGLPERHQTMEATIEWSFRLLSVGEQAVMRRLAVFVNGFTLEAAEAVTAFATHSQDDPVEPEAVLDHVASLMDKSLVMVDLGATTGRRFRLMEVVRQYARRELERAGEQEEVEQRHSAFYLALAERAEPHLRGNDSAVWLDRLDLEHGNLRAALAAARQRGDVGLAARFVTALWVFWNIRAHTDRELAWTEQILADAVGVLPLGSVAKLQRAAGSLAYRRGDYARARRHWTTCLESYRRAGDEREAASVLVVLGLVLTNLNEYQLAHAAGEEALVIKQRLGDEIGVANAAAAVANLKLQLGDYRDARGYFELSLEILRTFDGHGASLNNALRGLAIVLEKLGEIRAARSFIEEGITLNQAIGDEVNLASWHHLLGTHLINRGEFDLAMDHLRSALNAYRAVQHQDREALALESIGELECRRGNVDVAIAYLKQCLVARRRIGREWSTVYVLNKLAEALHLAGDLGQALALANESIDLSSRLRLQGQLAWAYRISARIARENEDEETARSQLRASFDLARALREPREMAMTIEALADDVSRRGNVPDALRLLGVAERIRTSIEAPRSASEQSEFDAHVGRARRLLGAEGAQGWLDHGRSLSDGEAVTLAAALFSSSPSEMRPDPTASLAVGDAGTA